MTPTTAAVDPPRVVAFGEVMLRLVAHVVTRIDSTQYAVGSWRRRPSIAAGTSARRGGSTGIGSWTDGR
jgi:hypothetical protein